jgi:hypothetical protein
MSYYSKFCGIEVREEIAREFTGWDGVVEDVMAGLHEVRARHAEEHKKGRTAMPQSRSSTQPEEMPASSPPDARRPRRRRTGRTLQFNVKIRRDPIEELTAIADKHQWVLGETIEHALDALKTSDNLFPEARGQQAQAAQSCLAGFFGCVFQRPIWPRSAYPARPGRHRWTSRSRLAAAGSVEGRDRS